MKRWFRDSAFRAIVHNASYLGSSKVVSGLLGLLALACAGRGMTPALFGTLVVVQAYARGVSDFAKFQSSQLVVRYGTPALTRQDVARFCDTTGFSFGLDLASGGVALIAGMALLPLVGHAVGIKAQDFWLALLYCTLIPVMTAATPAGILRALDRFDLLAYQEAIMPVLRAAGALVCLFAGLGFPGFIVVWYLSRLVGELFLWVFAIDELRRQKIDHALRPALRGPARRIKGAWNFAWTTNFAHSIWSAREQGSSVAIGVMLGPAAAGLFKIATKFFDAAGTPAQLMRESFYPEIMRLDPASKHPWKLAIRSSAVAGSIGVLMAALVIVAGEPVISAVFGQRYVGAYSVLRIISGALVVSMAGFPLESLLYMASRQRAALVARALAVGVYGILLVSLIYWLGLVGAAIAYFGAQCMESIFSLVPTLSAYRKRRSLSFYTPEDAPR